MEKKQNNMAKVTAPFNFVPLPAEPFLPDWGEYISHDVPFKDGLSGKIRLTLTAETPIFVRNGARQKSEGEQKEETFSQYDFGEGKSPYFLPGSSIKGEVRSVLEIMSFGKMRLDQRAMFAQREWDNTTLYTLRNIKVQNTIHCGYLRRKGKDYVIEDHGKPWRISHKDLDKMLGEDIFKDNFSQEAVKGTKEGKLTDEQKTAGYKYRLIEDAELTYKLFGETFSSPNIVEKVLSQNFTSNKVVYDPNGRKTGNIVLTGSPNPWIYPRKADGGKFREFVFPKEKIKTRPVSSEMFDHYKFIYDRKDEVGKKEWDRIRKIIENSEEDPKEGEFRYPGVPVFFRIDDNDKVKDFGFALLYKLPYDHTPYDTLSSGNKSDRLDMAECIFGQISKEPGKSLKGRVVFSNAHAKRAVVDDKVTVTLSSPKASYYPIYVKQQKGKPYKTYNDGQIRGWKRYVLKNDALPQNNKNEKIDSGITPLKTGAEFKCDVAFFNLRPAELGALLSAITFHGKRECRHQIGGGKPYGYGRTRVEVDSIKDVDGNDLDVNAYLGCFEDLMERNRIGWLASPTIKELFAMAATSVKPTDPEFKYMTLTTEDNNDFADAKKAKLHLKNFTEIVPQAANSGPASLRQIWVEKKAAGLEAEANELLSALKAVEISEDADLSKVIGQVAPIARKVEDILSSGDGLNSTAVGDLKATYAEKKEAIRSKITSRKDSAEAKDLEAKRIGFQEVKILIDEVAKSGLNISFDFDIDHLISSLPKAVSSAITEAITFVKRGRTEGDIKKWVKQKGEITEAQAQELNDAFRTACADAKVAKEFKGYKPARSLNELTGRPKGDAYGDNIASIIFNLD